MTAPVPDPGGEAARRAYRREGYAQLGDVLAEDRVARLEAEALRLYERWAPARGHGLRRPADTASAPVTFDDVGALSVLFNELAHDVEPALWAARVLGGPVEPVRIALTYAPPHSPPPPLAPASPRQPAGSMPDDGVHLWIPLQRDGSWHLRVALRSHTRDASLPRRGWSRWWAGRRARVGGCGGSGPCVVAVHPLLRIGTGQNQSRYLRVSAVLTYRRPEPGDIPWP
ncbi:hypothetical protein [Streptomyces sp. SID3343]|uniref:hypothetical protein n=1 Tax=Streptomyces sp. SID3343 TaxID=2690260 RepID=UPI00136EDA39|nr:hypothetical protein [Streptomyces sp. SID3343]MYW06410.1 hypothetical protein [Streptomyces sp. SID3343]